MKRKTISKKVREQVYQKYNGHCAYCGKELLYKDFQLDHLLPIAGWGTEAELECFENYMPTCRRCNHYKRAFSLEKFRKMIEEIPAKLYRDSYIYKIGQDYNLVSAAPKKVIFYFEQKDV